MGTRDGTIAGATRFRDRLAELVAIPSTSQDLVHKADIQRNLNVALSPSISGITQD
jgi:hypothetical protein